MSVCRGFGVVSAQPSVSVSTADTQPAYLGDSMRIGVNVQNQASIPMEVMSVIVTLDWGSQSVAGDTPRILQAGGTASWEFYNVTIPSDTWTGTHTYDVYVVVGWADSSGGFHNTLSSPVHVAENFAVQETPPISQSTTQAIGPVSIPQPANSVSGFPLNPSSSASYLD